MRATFLGARSLAIGNSAYAIARKGNVSSDLVRGPWAGGVNTCVAEVLVYRAPGRLSIAARRLNTDRVMAYIIL